MILATVSLVLGLAATPGPDTVTCESGRLVKVRTLERSEGPGGGPSPAANDDRPPTSARGALYFLTFRCGDETWQTRVVQGAPGLRREDLRVRDDVAFRVDDRTLYLKRPDGTELALRVAAPAGPSDGDAPRE